MDEYIKREATIDRLEKLFGLQAATARVIIKAIPAADVAPVRHGRWVTRPYMMGNTQYCSRCGENYGRKYNYCPNCGAKMDKEEE